MPSSTCIFCQIVERKLDASIVYQDKDCMVLMDLFPIKTGHMLVIPKQHGQYLQDHSEQVQAHLIQVCSHIIEAAKKAKVIEQDCNLVLNDGKVANQHIPHVHFHILPREQGDFFSLIGGVVLRMKNYFGQESRRQKLDLIAADVAKHITAV